MRSLPHELMEESCYMRGDDWRRDPALGKGSYAERSIAISLKRIADMMEEDRKAR